MACTITDVKGFSLDLSLNCGQAFRWKNTEDGWFGVVGGRPLFVSAERDKLLLSCQEEELGFWRNYFAVDSDYSPMEALLAQDPCTAPCLEYSRGIRILRQLPFEALISFIVSQNNNVARISGIIDRLCAAYGQKGELRGREYWAFPTATALAEATEGELTALGTGYRARYIVNSARAVVGGFDLEELRSMEFDRAYSALLTLDGVGPKVAECVMLFGLGFDRAFPVDVWVKRIVKYLYPHMNEGEAAKLVVERFGQWSGMAQQYLFHYARQVGLGKKSIEKRTNKAI